MAKSELVRLLTRAGDVYAEEGLRGVSRRTVRGVYRRAFETTSSLWLLRSLHWPTLHDEAGANDGTAIEFLVDDKRRIIDWIRRRHSEFPWMFFPEEIKVAGRERHIFVTLTLDGAIVGYIKLGINRVYLHDFAKVIRLPTGDCFIYDTFVLPQYRGRGLASRAILEAVRYMRAREFERMWCHIEQWNRPSLKLFTGVGFAEVARIRFNRVFGLSFFVRDGVVPFRSLERFLGRAKAGTAGGRHGD